MRRLPHQRYFLFLAIFALALAGFYLMLDLAFTLALVLGFDVAVVVFLVTLVPLLNDKGEADSLRRRAERDDGGRVLLLVMSVAALVVVIVAVGLLLTGRANLTSLDVVLVAGTMLLLWLFVNLVFAFHYSHLFYDQIDGIDRGGLQFPDCDRPMFSEFCYFSLVIAMTSQTSDVAIGRSDLRRIATFQGMIAFVFNFGVMALAINVVAGVLLAD